MRIGTSITFLVVILILFGYVISDDIQTHQKLSEVNGQITELNTRLLQAEESLRICTDQVAKDQQSIDERDRKISELTATISEQQGEIGQLKMEAAVTEAKRSLGEIFGSNPVVVAVLVVFQLLAWVVGQSKKVALGLSPRKDRPIGNYLKLTDAEYRLITQRRQAGR